MKNLQDFPRIPLAVLPTPIQKLENISRLLNTNVYIKRDDLTGIGLGGNKVRKLEFLLADAKRKGAEVVFTTGGAQSNHAMLTAACAKKLGMTPILILKKKGVTDRKGNQLLEYLMNTDVRFMDTNSYDDIYEEMDRVGKALGKPYYKIPCGGSNAIGALGYVNCMKEIADTGMHFDYVCCAEGSGGTHAGVALGAMLYMPQTKTVGLMVDSDPFEVITTNIMQETAKLLELDRGVTLLEGRGGFSGSPKNVILCAFSRAQIVSIKSIVKQADPDAFIIVCDAYEILGEGFGVNRPDGL
jgi:1-aminocyclopropane-1-carboxylate deaminase/D-cysteine desulfhydrase-like pyridoxal-dependent ACC family enzyme